MKTLKRVTWLFSSLAALITGFNTSAQDVVNLADEDQRIAYSIGVNIGQNLVAQELIEGIDIQIFAQGMLDAFADDLKLPPAEMMAAIQAYMNRQSNPAQNQAAADRPTREQIAVDRPTREQIIDICVDAEGLGSIELEDGLDILRFVGVTGTREQLAGLVQQLGLSYLDVLSATNQNASARLGVGSSTTVPTYASACQRRLRAYVGENY